jgi:hypothetical protein
MEMPLEQILSLTVQISMGICLAASAGLRAFLPLLVVGIAGRLEYLPLSSGFDWLESWPAITIFGVAVVFELVADKFPVVDNLLDVVAAWVKPIAGTVVAASVLTELSPLQATVLAIVLGGGAASAVHLLKANVRLISLVTTAGIGSPIVSTGEDAGALLGSIGAIVIPLLSLLVLVAVVVVAWVLIRMRARSGTLGPSRI